ncbi:MAG: hypothetical protein HDR88_16405 [Bacteroides sp.]|nr:hypothetical protein [Bacteroides sp.]
MNRKLFNGLLLLTVATGGVGMFTSCKDTEQEFRNQTLVGQKDLSDQIAAIRDLTDGTFKTNLDNEIQRLIDDGKFATAADLLALKNRVDAAETLLGQLQNKYDQLESDYKAADAALKQELENKINALETSMTTLIDDLKTDLTALETLVNTEIGDLKDRLDGVDTDITNIKGDITRLDGLVSTIQTTLDNIDTTLNNLETRLANAENKLTEVETTATDALTKATANEQAITGIQSDITDLQSKYDALKDLPTEFEDLKTKVDDLETKYNDLFTDLSTLTSNFDDLQSNFNDLQLDFNTLADDFGTFVANFSVWQEAVDQKLEEIDILNEEVSKLMNLAEAFKRLVTGLIVERTYNPVFGHISLPIGIESNMLVSYISNPSGGEVRFPSGIGLNQPGEDGKVWDVQLPIASADIFTQGPGEQRLETLGNLYMTINPINRNFDGLSFELVKSNGEALPVKFEANKCDEVLTFGYTRGETSPNGFYKAPIVPTTKDEAGYVSLINATRVELEPGLKSALKDVVKNHQAGDFLEVAKLIYRQFDGVLPQYAAKVTWTENDETGETKSVLSGYDMAVASFRPLSYSTAWGLGTDRELPTFGSLQSIVNRAFNAIKSRLNLGLTGIKYSDITINLDFEVKVDPTQITIDLSNSPIFNEPDVVYNSETDKYYNAKGEEVTPIGFLAGDTFIVLGYDPDGKLDTNETALNKFVDNIIDSIQKSLNGDPEAGKESLADQIAEQVNKQMKDIVDDINKQLSDVQAKVDNTVQEIQDRVNAQLAGRLGQAAQSLVDLYNRFATKVNDILKNPNAYLQVVMAYKGVNGDLHHLSTVATDPTYVDKGILDLYLTSYNAELIVPSYKKYVAITKVGDTVADATVNTTAGADFNKVLEGRQQEVAFNTSGLESGKTYEIFYQSLDYRGITSTRTYYVRVK